MSSPTVAEEKTRREIPLTRRSARTMNKPKAAPANIPTVESLTIIKPRHAVSVTKRARKRLIVRVGVIGGVVQRKRIPLLPEQAPHHNAFQQRVF